MKINFFRNLLPVVVVAFAFFGAASSASISSDTSLAMNEQGWYHLSPTQPCVKSTQCNEQGTIVCTVNNVPGAQQLFRKLGVKSCEFTLYKPIPQ
ncbi:DUF6520 family protein [Flavobacterium tegetincola]|uniref:DUF6520 family protein n=1 Tax=Flavobacterium tegetincola TaxID=150172 RepID=UPI00042A3B05|nr:DUF6520 family protein [Flavobacterium tegetincola]